MSKEKIRIFIFKNGFYPSLFLLKYLEGGERYLECVPLKRELVKIGKMLNYECLTTDENMQLIYDSIIKSENGFILEKDCEILCELAICDYEILLMESADKEY